MASDHAGFEAKEKLVAFLKEKGEDVTDAGPFDDSRTDYPDWAHIVAGAVQSGEAERGILLCGTGIGMCMSANRHTGVRAAVVHDEETTRMSREHNDANVLCLGARLLDDETINNLASIWLETPFGGGRHEGRVRKIDDLPRK